MLGDASGGGGWVVDGVSEWLLLASLLLLSLLSLLLLLSLSLSLPCRRCCPCHRYKLTTQWSYVVCLVVGVATDGSQ